MTQRWPKPPYPQQDSYWLGTATLISRGAAMGSQRRSRMYSRTSCSWSSWSYTETVNFEMRTLHED